jgi:hypothetical protein
VGAAALHGGLGQLVWRNLVLGFVVRLVLEFVVLVRALRLHRRGFLGVRDQRLREHRVNITARL